MPSNALTWKTSLSRLWALGCSLKLAIALASAATLLIMGGSLLMHFNPSVFGGMEQETMGRWLPRAFRQAPLLVSWIPLSGVCVILFAVNTLCCLVDWLTKVKARWRKTGEYLIHTGFILLTVAYLWGNLAGFRSGPHQIFPGETLQIPGMPQYSLRLEKFTPRLEPSGRPLDMINEVSLWKDRQRVAGATVKINHPLLYDGLVILPSSFGQEMQGFRFHIPTTGFINLMAGSRLPLPGGLTLAVHNLFPHARKNHRGEIVPEGRRLINPAIELSLSRNSQEIWRGWHFLRAPQPQALTDAGVYLRPVEPIYKTFSALTINRDPGDKLALAGGILISVGVFFAFFSFYRKRAQGDRPEV